MARRGIRSLVSLVALCSAIAGATAGAGATTGVRGHPRPQLSGINVLGRDLDRPAAVASDGSHVWVVNAGNSTVSMLDATTGLTVKTIDVQSLGNDADGTAHVSVVTSGTRVWLANSTVKSVTELNGQTGAVLRILKASAYGFDGPSAITSNGVDTWISNQAGSSVTEIDAASGALVHLLRGATYGFDEPSALAFDGTDLWVLNGGNGSITELDAATGAVVQSIAESTYHGSAPSALAVVGANLWVVDSGSDRISLLSTSTGALASVLDGGAGSFLRATDLTAAGADAWVVGSSPTTGRQLTELRGSNGDELRTVSAPSRTPWSAAVADDGTELWIVDTSGNGVTELSAATGAAVRVTYGAPYELSTPDAIAAIDGHVWVANEGDPPAVGESLLEFNATTGAYIRQVVGLAIAAPRELIACSGRLWLGSGYGSIVELSAATGRIVRALDDADYRYANVQAFACAGRDLWVVNTDIRPRHDSTTIDELTASTGKALRRFELPGSTAEFANAIVVADGELWVTASSRDSLTVLNASSGAVVRTYDDSGVLRSGGAEFSNGTDVFVADFNAIVELNASTGAVVRVIRGASYHLDLPFAFVADDQSLFVVNAGNSVTELSMRTGALVHVFKGTSYDFDDPVCATRAGADLWIGNAMGQSITEFPAR
jgi:DNA-binding beta-propeller fold protein YncE